MTARIGPDRKKYTVDNVDILENDSGLLDVSSFEQNVFIRR